MKTKIFNQMRIELLKEKGLTITQLV